MHGNVTAHHHALVRLEDYEPYLSAETNALESLLRLVPLLKP